MKSKLVGVQILLLTFLLSVIEGQSQNVFFDSVDKIEFSIGPSIVSLHNSNLSKIRQPKLGFSSRINFLYNLSEAFSLNVNVLYEFKGVRTRYSVLYYDPTIDSTNCQCTTSEGVSTNNLNLNYLTLLPQLRFTTNRKKIHFEIGFYYARLLKANMRRTNQWDNSSFLNNVSDQYKNFDAGISASITCEILRVENKTLNISLMNNYGLTNINDSKIVSDYTRTNSLTLQIGMTLKEKS